MPSCSSSMPVPSRTVRRPLLAAIAAMACCAAAQVQAATLVHQFSLDTGLDDALATGVSLAVHPNTATQSIDANGWTWTATSAPGGGLVLTTGHLTDPLDYSLGFRVRFNQVASGGGGGGSGYRKLISFREANDDNGLYFLNSQLVFYPFGMNTALTYSPDTFYDFVFSRSGSDNTIRVYVVEGDGTMTQVYEESDPGQDAVPLDVGGGEYRFMLFMDDTFTSTEWTSGGTCKSIRLWNGPLTPEEVTNAMEGNGDPSEEEQEEESPEEEAETPEEEVEAPEDEAEVPQEEGDSLEEVTIAPDPVLEAVTTPATDVTDTMATLNGTVNPSGVETTVAFEYGTSTDYGTTVTAAPSPIDDPSAVAVSAAVTGLAANTVYHFRVLALNQFGTSYGEDQTFTTAPAPVDDEYYVVVRRPAPVCGVLCISPMMLFASLWLLKRRGVCRVRVH